MQKIPRRTTGRDNTKSQKGEYYSAERINIDKSKGRAQYAEYITTQPGPLRNKHNTRRNNTTTTTKQKSTYHRYKKHKYTGTIPFKKHNYALITSGEIRTGACRKGWKWITPRRHIGANTPGHRTTHYHNQENRPHGNDCYPTTWGALSPR